MRLRPALVRVRDDAAARLVRVVVDAVEPRRGDAGAAAAHRVEDGALVHEEAREADAVLGPVQGRDAVEGRRGAHELALERLRAVVRAGRAVAERRADLGEVVDRLRLGLAQRVRGEAGAARERRQALERLGGLEEPKGAARLLAALPEHGRAVERAQRRRAEFGAPGVLRRAHQGRVADARRARHGDVFRRLLVGSGRSKSRLLRCVFVAVVARVVERLGAGRQRRERARVAGVRRVRLLDVVANIAQRRLALAEQGADPGRCGAGARQRGL